MYSATFYKNFMKQKSPQTKNCVTCVAKTAWCKGRRLAKSCCPSHQGIMEHNICWCHGAKMWILGRNTENCLPTQMFKFSSILKQGILWSPVWSKVQCSAIWPIFMYLHFTLFCNFLSKYLSKNMNLLANPLKFCNSSLSNFTVKIVNGKVSG